MKKAGVIKGICWLVFVIGFAFLLMGKMLYWALLCAISLAVMAVLDFMAIKKNNDSSDRIPVLEFKSLFAEVACCFAFLFILVLILKGEF